MDEGEAAGELLPGEAGRRPAQEHCAADYAEEHGLLEADRASGRTGRFHTLVRGLHLVGFDEAREKMKLVVCSVQGPHLEESEQSLGHT